MPVEFIGMISIRDQSEKRLDGGTSEAAYRPGRKHANAYALGGEPLVEGAGVAA